MARQKMPEAWANLKMWRVGGVLMSFKEFEALKAHDNRSWAQRWRRKVERLAKECGISLPEARRVAREQMLKVCQERLAKLGVKA